MTLEPIVLVTLFAALAVGGLVAMILAGGRGEAARAAATDARLRQLAESQAAAQAQMAAALHAFFAEDANRELIAELASVGIEPGEEAAAGDDRLAGKTFVLTGTLTLPRNRVKDMIQGAGGTVSSSVSVSPIV